MSAPRDPSPLAVALYVEGALALALFVGWVAIFRWGM